MKKLLVFVGGIIGFIAYISRYFKDGATRDNQKKVDSLSEALRASIGNEEVCKQNCNSEKLLLKIEYEQVIDELQSELASINPRVGGREIFG